MNQEWKQHLENAGAQVSDGALHFADAREEARAALDGEALAALSDAALVEVSGADAQQFLQSQLSNDVRAVSAERSQLSGYCNPKGRLLAAFRIVKSGDAYLLKLPAELLEATLKRLRMYVLRSQVQIEDASERMAAIGLSGPAAEARLRELGASVPGEVDAVGSAGDARLVRVPGSVPRFEIYGPVATVTALWDGLAAHASPVGPGAWALLDLRAGLPSIHAATVEAFVPQMVNLEVIGGVSFKKGCYPGQEVVARMHYLGKPKRRMFLAHTAAAGSAPAAGDDLFLEGESQSAGRVVDAQPSPEGGHDLLAVIQLASLDGGALHLGDAQGPVLELRELPYALERS